LLFLSENNGSLNTFLNLTPVRPGDLDDVVGYLMKTMTSQAHFAIRRSRPRLPGRHSLGEGGGDRVRLSKDLYDVLIRSGKIERYKRTYAIVTRPQQIAETSIVIMSVDRLFGDLPLFAIEPQKRAPQKRPLIAERYGAQAELPLLMAPSIPELASGLGSTHQAIAGKLGISRPHFTNIMAGRFRPSRRVIDRVLQLARAAA
jgi:hypothetical protein